MQPPKQDRDLDQMLSNWRPPAKEQEHPRRFDDQPPKTPEKRKPQGIGYFYGTAFVVFMLISFAAWLMGCAGTLGGLGWLRDQLR